MLTAFNDYFVKKTVSFQLYLGLRTNTTSGSYNEDMVLVKQRIKESYDAKNEVMTYTQHNECCKTKQLFKHVQVCVWAARKKLT